MNAVVEKVLPNLLSSITLENSSDLYSELANEILNANEKGTISALRGMANRKNHKYLLENIKIPTLLIFGEDDKITNLQTAVEIKEQITNSKLEIIKNCGHLSNLEQPSKFNRILIKFLNFNFQ